MPKLAIVSEPPPPEPPPPDEPPKEEIQAEDPRYFYLSEPIAVAKKTFERLLIDTSALKGPVYFKLAERFRLEHPEIYRTSFNKFAEEIFLAYVVAELNPPMIIDDLQKIDFSDLPILFMRMQAFLYAAQAAKMAKRTKAQGTTTP